MKQLARVDLTIFLSDCAALDAITNTCDPYMPGRLQGVRPAQRPRPPLPPGSCAATAATFRPGQGPRRGRGDAQEWVWSRPPLPGLAAHGPSPIAMQGRTRPAPRRDRSTFGVLVCSGLGGGRLGRRDTWPDFSWLHQGAAGCSAPAGGRSPAVRSLELGPAPQ